MCLNGGLAEAMAHTAAQTQASSSVLPEPAEILPVTYTMALEASDGQGRNSRQRRLVPAATEFVTYGRNHA